jgi:glyoxylase-like metal-dependent hydrolase (beta-lactamase superfamily II)
MSLMRFPAGPLQTNGYLLFCPETKKAVIIDAPPEVANRILGVINRDGLQVEALLLTHTHWDHIAGAAELKDKLGFKIYVHKDDAKNLESPGADGLPMVIPIEGVKPDGYLTDGQEIDVGNLKVRVIHTPGHAPGCVCFYLPKEGILISGDTLFKGGIGNLSLPTARPEMMRPSLEKLFNLPGETIVYPGHGRETTIEEERF